MGRHSQTLGPIREVRRIVVFEQPGIQATRGLNTALQKTKHFVLRVETSAHRRQRVTQHSLKLVSPPSQRRWKVIVDLKRSHHFHDSLGKLQDPEKESRG